MRSPPISWLVLATLTLAPAPAAAQGFPTRPVRLVAQAPLPDVREKLAALGQAVVMDDGAALMKYMVADQKRYVGLERQARIEPQ